MDRTTYTRPISAAQTAIPFSPLPSDTAGKTYLAGSTASGDFPVTANAFQNHFNGTFLYKTADAAKTWNRSDSGLPATASLVQVDPQQPSTVYAVSSGGLFKSTDGGATWHGTAAAAVSSLWIDPVDSTLYMGTTHGDFVRSRDGRRHVCCVFSRTRREPEWDGIRSD